MKTRVMKGNYDDNCGYCNRKVYSCNNCGDNFVVDEIIHCQDSDVHLCSYCHHKERERSLEIERKTSHGPG